MTILRLPPADDQTARFRIYIWCARGPTPARCYALRATAFALSASSRAFMRGGGLTSVRWAALPSPDPEPRRAPISAYFFASGLAIRPAAYPRTAGCFDRQHSYVATLDNIALYDIVLAVTMIRTDPRSMLPLTPAMLHVLLALADGDKHGYAIIKEVTRRTAGDVQLGAGTLYALVKRLLADDMIVETDERPDPALDDERRRYYRLTRFGRDVAIAEVRRLESIVSQAHAKKLLRVPAKGGTR
jgi:DNA-binding PadR family transcriptional regulator